MNKLPFLLLAAFSVARVVAATAPPILPDTIGEWKKGPAAAAQVPDQKVWQEYGLQASETTEYSNGPRKYSISAYRFADATGAFAAFEEARPVDAKPVEINGGLGGANGSDQVSAIGNYLFIFKGYQPNPEEINHVIGTVPHYAQAPLPTLPKYLPAGAQPNSERYILGPDSLAAFAPSIPPGTAAFHYSAEGQVVKYGASGKENSLVLFTYPTMEIARDRLPHFQEIAGAVAKRSGPLVAVVLKPTSADEAERLLSRIKYQAEITVPEHVTTPKDNPANLLLNIFILCLVLAGFCIVSGLVVGGLRILLRRSGASGEGDNMITLHLSGRP